MGGLAEGPTEGPSTVTSTFFSSLWPCHTQATFARTQFKELYPDPAKQVSPRPTPTLQGVALWLGTRSSSVVSGKTKALSIFFQ